MAEDPQPPDELPARFTCPECGMSSVNPNDLREGYCGNCHWWTGVPELYAAWRQERRSESVG